jgi:AraC-like DNA-binding protein
LSWSDQNQIAPGDLVVGLDARDPEMLLSYSSIRDGFARARLKHGSDALAIVTGSRKTVHHFGPLGPAQISQPTLGAAMHWGLERQFHVGSLLKMSLETTCGEATFECHRIFDDEECGALIDVDHMVAVYNIMSMFNQAPMSVERIELASGSSDLAASLGELLNAPVILSQPSSKLVIRASLLGTPNPKFDEMTRRFWTTLCDKEISESSRREALSLKELLELQDEIPSVAKLAERLHVSERTVHRMLAREGIDFSKAVDIHCQRRAETLLRKGQSTEAVAADLQFADERSFRRAFQRWTGTSPSAFRALHAGRE